MNNYRGLQLQLKALRELGYYSGSIKLKEYEIIAKLINIRDTYLKNPEYSFEENLKENLMYWLFRAGISSENHGFNEVSYEEIELRQPTYNPLMELDDNDDFMHEFVNGLSFLKKINNGTCIICYDTEDKLYQLRCHEKHVLCKECIDELDKCPIDNKIIRVKL